MNDYTVVYLAIPLLMGTEVASSFSLLQAKLSIHPCVLVFHIYLAHIICRLTGYTQLQLYQMLLDCSPKTFVYSEWTWKGVSWFKLAFPWFLVRLLSFLLLLAVGLFSSKNSLFISFAHFSHSIAHLFHIHWYSWILGGFSVCLWWLLCPGPPVTQ